MPKRLTDKHPHAVKLEKVHALVEDLGVKFEFLGFRTLVTIEGVTYDLEDKEDGSPVTSFPPMFEVKLVLDR